MVEVPLQSVLAEQAELQDCLMRVESSLARAEAVLCRLTIMPDVPPLAEIQVDSKGEGEEDPFGCFSPRGRHIVEVVTPVMQIMPGLQELCEAPSPPLSMVLPKEMGLVMPMMPSPPMLAASPPFVVVDNEGQDLLLSCEHLETPESIVSVVPVTDDIDAVGMLAPDPLEPSQPLAFVDRGGFDVSVTQSHVTVGQVSVRDKVNEILFELEIHSLLARLERASPGSGKKIVEEALRSKSKKSSAT